MLKKILLFYWWCFISDGSSKKYDRRRRLLYAGQLSSTRTTEGKAGEENLPVNSGLGRVLGNSIRDPSAISSDFPKVRKWPSCYECGNRWSESLNFGDHEP